jgi:hypothetical protein
MSKEKNKGNKEAKKPKKETPKVLATANSGQTKDGTTIAGKKIKEPGRGQPPMRGFSRPA